jgi:hypothetical protein
LCYSIIWEWYIAYYFHISYSNKRTQYYKMWFSNLSFKICFQFLFL